MLPASIPEWGKRPFYSPENAPEIEPENCPHCGTKFVAYQRMISGSMCSALAMLASLYLHRSNPYWDKDPVKFPGDAKDWWPSESFMRDHDGERVSGGPHTFFRLWGLTESVDRKGNAGVALHTLRPFGLRFIRGEVQIPRQCVEVRQERKFYIGPMVSFRDCVGKKFDFDVMMRKAGLA